MEAVSRGREGVVNPQPFFSRDNQLRSSKISKMPGRGGLRDVDDFNEIANAQGGVVKQVQDPQSDRIGQRAKFHIRGASVSKGNH